MRLSDNDYRFTPLDARTAEWFVVRVEAAQAMTCCEIAYSEDFEVLGLWRDDVLVAAVPTDLDDPVGTVDALMAAWHRLTRWLAPGGEA